MTRPRWMNAERVGAAHWETARPHAVGHRGMADAENLQRIKARGHHYLVAARQPERELWLAEFDAADGFVEVIRPPLPRNPGA